MTLDDRIAKIAPIVASVIGAFATLIVFAAYYQ
jgi:hypothetical protein